MGITGANFGVVETGTICLVTNEGNGRMVTTMPRVHVALMGIEKLVETMDELDSCLKVLARSATGQKITVYTTLVRAPRGRGGRRWSRANCMWSCSTTGEAACSPERPAEILACIRCGACLNACPVYRTIGGHAYGDTYPGPVGAIVTPGIRGLHPWSDLAHASSLCGACRDVCPVRIDIPRMLLSLRHQAESTQPRALKAAMRMFAWTATRPRVYRAATRAVRRLLAGRGRGGWIERLPGLASGWTLSRDLRTPARRSFQDQWLERGQRNAGR